jgi:uncharacterized membrane protein
MLQRLLGLEDVESIARIEWYFRLNWPKILLAVGIAAAIAYAMSLYHRERLLRRRRRILLGVLRSAAFAIILLLLFEPVMGLTTTVRLPRTVLVLMDVSDSMNIRDDRRLAEDRRSAALGMGKLRYEEANASVPDHVLEEVSRASRVELAKSLLKHPTAKVFEQIAANYEVRYFTFGDALLPPKGKGETMADKLQDADASDRSTRLGTALEEALARFTGQSISGIVILTDGAANEAVEPVEVARRMKERTIPLYPIGLGLAEPADVRMEAVIVPETVFVKDRVPVRVQVSSSGFLNRRAEVKLKFAGREVASESLTLDGKSQFLELEFEPRHPADAAKLEVSVELEGTVAGASRAEASRENNALSRTLTVTDKKIKVLYVEGKPRWEYRYLYRVLLRDHRLDVKFLMTEGDKELAQNSKLYIATFPLAPNKAFDFDLVIVGDVANRNLTALQMQRMEQLVREQGGSLLMLAGLEHAPVDYAATPLAKALPVKALPVGWEPVDDAVHPEVTPDGQLSAVTSLEFPPIRNRRLWQVVHPLYQVPRLDGLKDGATALLVLSDTSRRREPYPLVAWHRYGRGRAMYVGTDQLWRLRFKEGDKYHARFWGQAIRFLTLSKLLSGNKRIQLETDRHAYRTGERVHISANVLDEAYSPVLAESFDVLLQRQVGEGESITVRLDEVPGMPGLFRGFFAPEKDGRYELRAPDTTEKIANTVRFDVEAVSLERREPAMQEELLRRLADVSGGKYFSVSDFPGLGRELRHEQRLTTAQVTKELFDLPVIFALLLLLLGAEWLLRRRFDLI